MDVLVRIPDDIAARLGDEDQLEQRVLEALALEEFKLGHLTRSELRRLLGFATRSRLDEFLAAHQVFGTYTADDLERDPRDLERLGFRTKGVRETVHVPHVLSSPAHRS